MSAGLIELGQREHLELAGGIARRVADEIDCARLLARLNVKTESS
jgi:hypothetical protein